MIATMGAAIAHWARFRGEHIAIRSEGFQLTYWDLWSAAGATLRELQSVEAGSPVAVMLDDKIAFSIAYTAIVRRGAHPVFLSPTHGAKAIQEAICSAGCSVIFADPEHAHLLGGCQCTPVMPHLGTGVRTSEFEVPQASKDMDSIGAVFFSSGTSGSPKGIVRTNSSVTAESLGWIIELSITKGSTVYVGRPLYYTGGCVIAMSAWLIGATVESPKTFSVNRFRMDCEQQVFDVAFLIPDQLAATLSEVERNGGFGRFPTRTLTMGAPVPQAIKRAWRRVTGNILIESWGNSEGLGTISDDDDAEVRPQSIGRPFLGDEMLVVDNDGYAQPPGRVGRLAGRTASRLREYLKRPDLNSELIRGDLVISEDLAEMDSDGYFHLRGRVSERFLRNGHPVYACDIMAALKHDNAVEDAVVFGMPDVNEGMVPVALVVKRLVMKDSELLDRLNHGLLSLQRIVKLKSVVQLPRNAGGKVCVEEARKLFLSIAD